MSKTKRKKVVESELKYLYELKHEMRCAYCGEKISADGGYLCSSCDTQNDYKITTPEGYII